jgi:hypothetical protein
VELASELIGETSAGAGDAEDAAVLPGALVGTGDALMESELATT